MVDMQYSTELETDVLITGGGASGVCAAIQAARMSVDVVLVEESEWLGGMLSAAGVSAIDGNHKLPSGLWGEFRRKIYQYYGGPEKVHTGWVSNTLFEPSVANKNFHDWIAEYPNIKLIKGYRPLTAIMENNCVLGGRFTNSDAKIIKIKAQITIEATEYGDFLKLAGCEYRLGRESSRQSGELAAPSSPDSHIQDLTYIATLKDYGPDADMTITKPRRYNPDDFKNCCSIDGSKRTVSAREMLEYGRLPNSKYMINWPKYGNDFDGGLVEKDREQRNVHLQKAKQQTLGFIYFIQTELGFKNLGLSDEFPTDDKLAIMPYIRESRRIKGVTYLTLNDLIDPYNDPDRPLYQQGITVGDYPIDHHHAEGSLPQAEKFPEIPSFTVPYGCLVPDKINGLLVAEKSISVTHIVNGATRLQPVVMQIGQAAGAAAALCVNQKSQPVYLNIRELQQVLLDTDVWLLPFVDISPEDKSFQPLQRMAASGLLKGEGKADGWANRFYIYPEQAVYPAELEQALKSLIRNEVRMENCDMPKPLSRIDALRIIWNTFKKPAAKRRNLPYNDIERKSRDYDVVAFFFADGYLHWIDGNQFNGDKPLTRKEYAILMDDLLKPFEKLMLFLKR